MHRTTWLTPSERRYRLSTTPTPSGSSEVLSTMTERRPDTESDRPTIVGAWVDGTYYMGEADGDSGEWLSADATVEIEHAR